MRKIILVFISFFLFLVIVSVVSVVLAFFVDLDSENQNLDVAIYDNSSLTSVKEAEVEVYDLEHNLVSSGVSDSRGVVSFSLPSGDYLLSAKRGNYEESWFDLSVSGSVKKILEVPLNRIDACIENWTCSLWTECVDGFQSRSCSDSAGCGTKYSKPFEFRGCSLIRCSSDSDCSDGHDCSVDSCLDGEMCINSPIVSCVSGDGCCPLGCNEIIDEDCGVGSESCFSVFQCDDQDPCTRDECDSLGKCVNTVITECVDGDGCCPEGCEDSDCRVCSSAGDCDDQNPCTEDLCFDGFCSYSELDVPCANGMCCDGECVGVACSVNADCGVDTACFKWTCIGSGCDASCSGREITECVDDDGCCPEGCEDSDCDICSSECEEDEEECSGNRLKVCGDFDSDDCLEWDYRDCDDCSCSCGVYTEDAESVVDCYDGLDNDCDGDIDFDDSDCTGCIVDGGACSEDADCCNGKCDDETGLCFSCISCSSFDERCNSNEPGECEAQCNGHEECDDMGVDSTWIDGMWCYSCEDCEFNSDNTVGSSPPCSCTSSNCVSGFCAVGHTCYYDVSCRVDQNWVEDKSCSTEDRCSDDLIVNNIGCEPSGCTKGDEYPCDKSRACKGPDYVECSGVQYLCSSAHGKTWSWVEDGFPEDCGDKHDNDCNGLTDCADPQCVGDPSCDVDSVCAEACYDLGCSGGSCDSKVETVCERGCQHPVEKCVSPEDYVNELCALNSGLSELMFCVCSV